MTQNQQREMIRNLSTDDFDGLYQMIDMILKSNDLDWALLNIVIQEKAQRDMVQRIKQFRSIQSSSS